MQVANTYAPTRAATLYNQRSKRHPDKTTRLGTSAQWQLCPNAIILTGGGDVVLIDGAGRPIAKVYADEQTEILSPDAEVESFDGRGPTFLHYDFGLPPGPIARAKIRAYIEKYNLTHELRRRRELLHRGELTCVWGM